jgi:Leucine-rich repeat (LRR) protein
MCTGQIKILSDSYSVISAIGDHMQGKSNNDVTLLDLNSRQSNKIRDIRYIPEGLGKVFPKLKILYIQNCKLKSLSRKNFANMDNLSTISLTKNQIENIDPDTFYDVPMLFSIRLNGNKLSSLSNELFIHAPRLKHVILSNNLLEVFYSNIFDNNKDLRSLDLSYNKLKTIFIDFPEFKDIQLVDLRGNQCINDIFITSKSLRDFQNSIKKNCSQGL